jgi:hypothetical protein
MTSAIGAAFAGVVQDCKIQRACTILQVKWL